MKKATVLLTVLALAILGAAGAGAQEQDPIQKAIAACQPEIEAYCSQVIPGGGRLMACFFAHEDKLSGSCSWALYEGAAALEDFVAAVAHLASECREDLVEHCGEVEMGEGRVATCLLEHRSGVSEACDKAIDDVGLEMVEEEE